MFEFILLSPNKLPLAGFNTVTETVYAAHYVFPEFRCMELYIQSGGYTRRIPIWVRDAVGTDDTPVREFMIKVLDDIERYKHPQP